MSHYPSMFRVVRPARDSSELDLDTALKNAVRQLVASSKITDHATVRIAVGSRGIADLGAVVGGLVRELRESSTLKPELIPAMGSHAGATAPGQAALVRSLVGGQIVEDLEIAASMETQQIGETSQGVPVHIAKSALEADGVIICNRVKPHTMFAGKIQSGLLKMMTVGLGKQAGAAAYHRASRSFPFDDFISEAASLIFQHVNILGGLALIEDGNGALARIETLRPEEFLSREPELLDEAIGHVPRLPVKQTDLLIVDEIGKEISGTGMDANVIGRKFNDHVSTERDWCQTSMIYVRGLTRTTGGNALGIGIAEFTNRDAVQQIDWQKTTMNAITSGHPTASMTPLVLDNDREIFDAVISIVGEQLRIVHVRNTLDLETTYVSESCLEEVEALAPAAEIDVQDNYYAQLVSGFDGR